MNKLVQYGVALLALCGVLNVALGAEETVTETRSIDQRVVRIKLDGIIDLKLKQGATASLVIIGDKRLMAKTTTVQSGDTLEIDTETRGFKLHRSALRAELTLPALREIVSEGIGSTEVNGFSGDDLALTLEGAGAMKVWCNYKHVSVNLGGVGSMNLQGLNNDSVDLDLSGAGYVTLGGRTKVLKADLGGLGGLDAQQFTADTVKLELSGLGNATITAKQNATLNLSGLGSVTVYGKPLNRNVSVDGLGRVSWK